MLRQGQTRVVRERAEPQERGSPSPAEAPARARVHDLAGAFLLVVLPLEPRPEGVDDLTPTELAVARLAASGMSNRALARVRDSAERTVANQLAAVYRKLRISGRRELRARMAQGQAPSHG